MSAKAWRAWRAGDPLGAFGPGALHASGRALLVRDDCLAWLSRIPAGSIDAVVTDPPYGVKEFDADQLARRASGKGGLWRIPPRIGGSARAPLPRFTVLSPADRAALRDFFTAWSRALLRAMKPGAHALVAGNAFLALEVFHAISEGGLEYRGSLVRLVRTLRGGDRPKGAEEEFPGVCSMPRSAHEPWGIFRAPLPPGMTVAQCLRAHGTGALRRNEDGTPFTDVIASERTPRRERDLADHPSLKPQSLLRPLVRAALPLGRGVIVDPFMGSGSTVAAALAEGLCAVGVERDEDFAKLARRAIPRLAGV